MDTRDFENFDWSRFNSQFKVKHGNISMIASTIIKNGEVVANPSRQRFIWPSSIKESDSNFFSKRIKGRF